jgi:hypothetical protein
MLNRIAICCLGLLVACLLVVGYFWFRIRLESVEGAKEANAFLAEGIAQKDGLESLGDFEISPSDLSLEKLEAKFHRPELKQPGWENTTRVGWACGVKHCAILASFLVPFGQEIPPTMRPATLGITLLAFSSAHHQAIGGIYVGQAVEEMKESCQKRGYGLPVGRNRITWDGDWSLLWGDRNGKIDFFTFANEKMIKSVEPHRDAGSAVPVDVSEGDTK